LAIFTALLLVSLAVPVFAESPSGEVVVASEDEAEKLPDAADVAEGLHEAKELEAEEQQLRETPRAEEERAASTNAYADLTAAQAEALLQEKFAEQWALIDQDPARALSDVHLDQVLGPDTALVTVGGDTMLVEGTIPVRATDDEGDLAKVDLDLEQKAEGYVPENPITGVTLPGDASEPVSVGDEGFAISPTLSESPSPARPLEGEDVLYFETQKDSDLIVSPLTTGVELFSLLRSAESPEELRFEIALPAGAELHADGEGGAEVVREGDRLIRIPAPRAFDAQGADVPVAMRIEGNSLVLAIEHRGRDVAYPILVDPEVVHENWYDNGNDWYHGGNLWALEPGTSPWVWGTNNGGRFWAGTKPISSKPGLSERGLFISATSLGSSQPANQYGQFTLTAPGGSDSYFSSVSINPFWRWDQGCGYQTYPEPHDYSGLWSDTWGWATFHSNWARIYGYGIEAPFEQLKGTENEWRATTGHVLDIGMGTGSGGGKIPCWRDLYAGGVNLWMDDGSQPVLTTSSTGQWMDNTPVRLNVSATDTGLGVRKFEAEATNKSGGTQKWDTWNSCLGGFKSPCPKSWNLGEASQPQLGYDPSVLPEGIDTLNVTAYDAVLRKSTTTNGMTVRVDHAAPTVTLSGTVTEQATLGTERPEYTIRADAKDGVPGSEKPADARSGVDSIVIKNDGQVIGEYKPGCPTQSCSAFDEREVPAAKLTPGPHTLSVTATDVLGHTSSPVQFNYTTGDKQAPVLSTTGLPAESATMPRHANYWSSFGANGTGDGQLKTPADVAIDSNGDLWVADKGNNRVQKLSSSGEYLMKFGSTGSGNGQFSSPASIAIDPKGNIWVADKGNSRVQKFNGKGEYLTKFGSKGAGNGQFASGGPEGIAIDPKGNIWVTDTYAGRIQKFDENGNFLKVAGSKGSGTGQLGEPTGIDIGPNGKVWVTDWQNNRISVFSEAGEFVTQFGSAGTGNGQFNRPDAIAVGSRGDVWVGDQNNGRIEEFDQNGAYVGKFGSQGSGSGQFNFTYPMGVATDSKGSLWIADTNNHRIQRWLIPNTTVSGYLEPLSATATDTGFGVTSLSMKLTDGAGSTEVLGQATQACGKGGCPLSYNLEEFNLSEKPSGPYLLTFEATDAAGNVRRISRAFSLDSAPPEIELSGSLAESAGQPLAAPSAELEIDASDSDPASGGIKTLNVERDGQLVASYPSDCSSDCHEVEASYTFQAKEDGAQRSIQPVANTSEGSVGELKRLSCVIAADCWAVGRTKYTAAEQAEGKTAAPLLERWNGEEWLAVTVPKPEGATGVFLEGVSCGLTSACIAVGYYSNGSSNYPLAERWDGTKWTISSPPLPSGASKGSLYGISCSSASCWAYGRTQVSSSEQAEGKTPFSYVVRWKGLNWLTATAALKPASAVDAFLEGVSCNSSSACIVVGSYTDSSGNNYPLAERWDGTQWNIQAPPLPSGASKGSLYGISCSSASNCWADGKTQVTSGEQAEGKVTNAYLVQWDGSTWKTPTAVTAPGGSENSLASIACSSASACTVVGRYSNGHSETLPLAYTWDGSEWRFQPVPTPTEATNSSLEGVSCTSANQCAMVGYSQVGSGKWTVLAETEAPGQEPHQITVEAVDVQGNSESKSIEIDVPSSEGPPECNVEPELEPAQDALTPTQAIDSVEEALPVAVAPTEGAIAPSTEEVIDPSYSTPSPNLDTVDALADGETSVTPEGGFTLGGSVCFSPATLTPAATDATVVNDDAALFANTGPETDTVIRPTAMGTTVIQSLRGPNAPDSFAWNVNVSSGQELVELPSGDVAVVEIDSEVEEVTPVPPEPEKSAADLADVEVQVENGEYALIDATEETQLEVVAVIARPWVVLAQGGTVPAMIEVIPDTETPNEFEVVIHPFLTEEEAAVWPVQVVTETASASSVSGGCSKKESPCGALDLDRMARYAVYWGNPEHHGARNPFYHDYGSENCTNFVSQVLRAGRAKFMRAFEHGDGSWWYYNFGSGGVLGDGPSAGWDNTESWSVSDKLPRHLWRFALVHIDPVQQPWGWTKGDILDYDWFDVEGKGKIDHLDFVVGTQDLPSGREPLIANSSSKGANYARMRWKEVKERIERAHGSAWTRFALAAKHRVANLEAKKHDPDNLYGASGLFHG
jgi:sugar lactone lactonase YvrE